MSELKASKKLKKELRLFDVYAIATGTTLSAGFFLLPGIAAQDDPDPSGSFRPVRSAGCVQAPCGGWLLL